MPRSYRGTAKDKFMPANLDVTHAVSLRSWVASSNGHPDFPIQNLPIGIVSFQSEGPRCGIAIGGSILDVRALLKNGLLDGDAAAFAEAASGSRLNGALALGSGPRIALRRRVSALLQEGAAERAAVESCIHEAESCAVLLPAAVGGYTDFYTGIHHATTVGKLFRPNNPLMPNYKWVPIAYHGRASSIRPSGTPVKRPKGQIKPPDSSSPVFESCRQLDYELELGIWIGEGNELGEPISAADAADHIGGYCLLNDWSARDIQAWEYQPLGPFLAKSFATTISPWIITPEALVPFRASQAPRPPDDPEPLPYLTDPVDIAHGAFDIELEVLIATPKMARAGQGYHRLSLSNARHMYWTPAQMVTHHTSNGCGLNPADLLGTGTISGPGKEEAGSLLETTQGGRAPIVLPSGETRMFLEDYDEVLMLARCHREGFASIGFGVCKSIILPSD
jgi:fumarylacetoacetase